MALSLNTPTMNTKSTTFDPTHIVVDLGSHVIAGCRDDDKERIRTILEAGFVPTDAPPDAAIDGWAYFRSTDQETA